MVKLLTYSDPIHKLDILTGNEACVAVPCANTILHARLIKNKDRGSV